MRQNSISTPDQCKQKHNPNVLEASPGCLEEVNNTARLNQLASVYKKLHINQIM